MHTHNFPAPRDIPAGKVLLASYGEARREDYGMTQEIDRFHCTRWGRGVTIRLEWRSPGWEIAGSMLRWENAYWAVRWNDGEGCVHGQRYTEKNGGEDAARAHFARLMS